ncbi:hypothetical protein QTP86_016002, partial [Hemibagrus guttatus]
EFSSFILVSVYIPPDVRLSTVQELLADQITHTEQRYPDSFIIILSDFYKANLTHKLPKYRQHITCPTRDNNILDHCYTVLKNSYHSVPHAALGLSDHCLVHLLPAYKQKLKSAKPVRSVKRWTNEGERDLQACFILTAWSVFETAATDLDELTDTVTSVSLHQAKEEAYRSGDKVLYKQAKYTLNREIRVAKQNYSEKLKKQLSSNDSSSVWNGLKAITSYKTPSPGTEANQQLAEDLNEFYCRKTLHYHPCTQETKNHKNNDYIPVALMSVVMKSFERLVLAYFKDITGLLLDPLQFAYRANRSVDDAVNMGLHYILQHLDKPGTYARILFVDFSSAFNTIIPGTLLNKLTQLSVPTSICQWITSFLTDRQQRVRLGKLPHHQHRSSSGLRSLPTAFLSLHK